jgi:hypothetical protein
VTYHDIHGNPVTLDKLCRIEPAWAANRLRVAEKEHELACAVADAWVASGIHSGLQVTLRYASHDFAGALDALETATRNSPLRKVKP